MWVVPASRMKMNEAHEVPLARQVAEIFREHRGCMGRSVSAFLPP
jgi:hypothetical protein